MRLCKGLVLGSDMLEGSVEVLGPEVDVGVGAEAHALDQPDQRFGIAAHRLDRFADDRRLPIAVERDGDGITGLVERHVIGELCEQEEPAAAGLLDRLGAGRIGHATVIEAGALVGDLHPARPGVNAGPQPDQLAAVAPVAVLDRVGERLGERDPQVDQLARPVAAVIATATGEQPDDVFDNAEIAG